MYDAVKHTSTMYCGKNNKWYVPPAGAICVMYEDECHYQYLRLKEPIHGDRMTILSNHSKSMRLRYKEMKKKEPKKKSKAKKQK